MIYEFEGLLELGFCRNVVIGTRGCVKGAIAAVTKRKQFLKAREMVMVLGKPVEPIGDFVFDKPDGEGLVTMSDILATVAFHQEYFSEYPAAFSLTEERAYLAAWPSIMTRCLSRDNWHFLPGNPDNTVVDGIDGSGPFSSGFNGCGVMLNGVKGWAAYGALPSADQYDLDGVACPFISVAEVGVGVATWNPGQGWSMVDVPALGRAQMKTGHGITIFNDPRYKALFDFLNANGGSEWVYSIGHAIAEEMVSGKRGLYLHGELAPHDFHPARVFLEAMKVDHFTFVVDPHGKFSLLPPGCQPSQYNPALRFGICGGYDGEKVLAIKQFILQNLGGDTTPPGSLSSQSGSRFFVATGPAS